MNSQKVATAAHYLTRAIILAGFAFFIVHLVRSGNLNLYIANRMQFIVKLSALGLYAVAAQQLYSAIRTGFEKADEHLACDCNHEMPATWGKSLLLYGWFAIPLVIGFTVPDGLLGSSMASAKGVQFTPQQIVKPYESSPSGAVPNDRNGQNEPIVAEEQPNEEGSALTNPIGSDETAEKSVKPSPSELSEAALDLMFPTDEFTEIYAAFGKRLVRQDVVNVTEKQFIETLTTIDLYRTAFIGKTIKLSGFVYREETMGRTQFGVSRFAINCCSADASPYGIMVTYGRADTLATDEWVTVTGKLGTTSYNGIEIIEIDVSKVVKIAPPDDPYVSPDLDFGLE
ncbi:TIGR03943 family putative permease subunit [Cohnella herbarum]|uniref:TIGR03943 family protein n=1 Tax=Cohnella herbarum TaxID=2728023 RepID=A0A7Z2VJ29_9BACL|nr:TIGR03943 family protein [Cohnella herbarum]QJD84183.1 TIGR03943 family protein [Cohnella herbarum]